MLRKLHLKFICANGEKDELIVSQPAANYTEDQLRAAAAEIIASGIFYSDGSPYAQYNGATVEIDDEVNYAA